MRLYPVPLRYVDQTMNYKLYQWIRLPMKRSPGDPRPESYKVDHGRIEIEGHIDPGEGWAQRRQIIFADRSWHFGCLDRLKEARITAGRSIGFIKVRSVEDIRLMQRSDADRIEHEEKLRRLQSVLDLFRTTQKHLEFLPFRVKIAWHCVDEDCGGHTASVLDWGLGELGRREGPGAAKNKMEHLADVTKYDLHFFVGNMKARPHIFSIIGLWYPLMRHMQQQDLFRV